MGGKYNKGLVVVLMTSYNHEKFIGDAIESVLNQTYKNIKLVVVDDCSQDSSREIIKNYKKKYPNKIDYVFNEINMHVNRSFNRGIEYIKNKYNPEFLATIASDDFHEKVKTEKELIYLNEYKHLDGISSGGIYIDEFGSVKGDIPLDDLFNKNLLSFEDCEKYKMQTYKHGYGGPLMQSTLFRFESVYNIKYSTDSISDDYAFFVRYFSNGYSLGYLNEKLWRYRLHDKNAHRTMDYFFVVLDVVNRYIPMKYKKTAFFNQIFLHSIYQFFYHKNRINGIRFFIFSLTYINMDSLKYFGKKFFRGIKWIANPQK